MQFGAWVESITRSPRAALTMMIMKMRIMMMAIRKKYKGKQSRYWKDRWVGID